MATKIIRRSTHAFLESYQLFTSIASLLVLPASFFILLSQAVCFSSSMPILRIIYSRLWFLFAAKRFPASKFFAFVNRRLTQAIFSFIFTLPFALTFLLLAKASIIRAVNESSRRRLSLPLLLSSCLPLYRQVLLTHLFNSFIMLTANATVFSTLFFVFNAADVLGLASSTCVLLLSAAGFILYAVVFASATAICNLSIVVSAMENCSGCHALIRACVLVRGRVATAVVLAIAANLGMALAESLFQHRVMRPYYHSRKLNTGMIWEACMIAYVYSLVVVLDLIMNCTFFDRCKLDSRSNLEDGYDHYSELEPEEKSGLQGLI